MIAFLPASHPATASTSAPSRSAPPGCASPSARWRRCGWPTAAGKCTGGQPGVNGQLALWALPAGIVGASVYHVLNNRELYRHNATGISRIWAGGLRIWGGVAAGTIPGLLVARGDGSDLRLLVEPAAPASPSATRSAGGAIPSTWRRSANPPA